MARKKAHEPPANHERWLVSYADFITLLFAFFVVMYAISELDKEKLVDAAESLKFALDTHDPGGKAKNPFDPFDVGAANPFGILEPAPDQIRAGAKEEEPVSGLSKNKVSGPSLPAFDESKENRRTPEQELAQLNRLKTQVEASILIDGLEGTNLGIEVEMVPEGLRIRLPGHYLFEHDSPELRDDAWSLLADLSAILRSQDRPIRIDGHEGEQAADNGDWERSILRASRIVRFLISRGGVEPERISAAGSGAHQPIADTASPDGRAANERYEIVVLAYGS